MQEQPIYVIGHRNPDTDSICAALSYARLKQITGSINVIAARTGEANVQTEFILNMFGMDRPLYLPDVKVRVKDVMTSEALSVNTDMSIGDVLDFMNSYDLLMVPVTDRDGYFKGAITLQDLAKFYVRHAEAATSNRLVASLLAVAKVIHGNALFLFNENETNSFRIVVGAMEAEGFLEVLKSYPDEGCIVIVGDRKEIQQCAAENSVRCLIITGGYLPDKAILETARKNKVSIISAPYDTATTVRLLHLSTPVHEIYSTDFYSVSPFNLLLDVKNRMLESGHRGCPVVDDSGRLTGILTRRDMLKEYRKRVILVDHNEASQAIPGIEEAEVVEVYDHHRIGSFQTLHPILFVVEPVGCTNTLIAELYQKFGLEPEKEYAGIMLSAILSDTVILRSPTTTERDVKAATYLAEVAGLNIQKHGEEIFNASSDLLKKKPEEIIKTDYKIYEVGKHNIGIGQIEVIEMLTFEKLRESLLEALNKILLEDRLTMACLLVSDIIYENSLLLFTGDSSIVTRMGYPILSSHLAELKGVLSRKKQLVPRLLSSLK
ncbi:MAG: putative manganese-dependent inorganic diphosphatase [Nitrospirae bacterium]|nr:putative manganese-dependent inorganic diphosphatase [Nitrospirota bacterium]